jgi:hypothetical protein
MRDADAARPGHRQGAGVVRCPIIRNETTTAFANRSRERFKSLTGQIEAVNEAICDARPALAEPGGTGP